MRTARGMKLPVMDWRVKSLSWEMGTETIERNRYQMNSKENPLWRVEEMHRCGRTRRNTHEFTKKNKKSFTLMVYSVKWLWKYELWIMTELWTWWRPLALQPSFWLIGWDGAPEKYKWSSVVCNLHPLSNLTINIHTVLRKQNPEEQICTFYVTRDLLMQTRTHPATNRRVAWRGVNKQQRSFSSK